LCNILAIAQCASRAREGTVREEANPVTFANQFEREDLSLVVQAVQRLKAAILHAELAPGTRLRLESLQEMFGFSSSPLREALNRIVAEGYVEVEDRRGFRVKPVSIEELNDITRVRVLIERAALKESIARGDDEWEANIIAALHRMQAAQGNLAGADLVQDSVWSARHRQFHAALNASCGSPNLLHLCHTYFIQAERYRHVSARFRKTVKNPTAGHRPLLDAALNRQTKLALELITDHIEQAAKGVAAALASYPFETGKARKGAPSGARARKRRDAGSSTVAGG
jgi:DNA-binding GntR family transcriptional regulator